MRVAMITRTLIPGECGIGDFTLALAGALEATAAQVSLITGRSGSADARVHNIGDLWSTSSAERARNTLASLSPDLVVLHYTPQMYAGAVRGGADTLERFWADCGRTWRTALTLHEAYFRIWRYPPSLIRGTLEKARMRRLVECSGCVLTASQPLLEELRTWAGSGDLRYVPIGSAIPTAPDARGAWRASKGIEADEIVLTLFGGGTSLRWSRKHVDTVDAAARLGGHSIRWVFLGGIPPGWFSVGSPVHAPGRVDTVELSSWLQASDIFLMPHYSGICGKRSTLMAAMQHGLPVVGTRGDMTDAFWEQVPGVVITRRARADFAAAVLKLCADGRLRRRLGDSNRACYSDRFAWKRIAAEYRAIVTPPCAPAAAVDPT